jgi:hypothetical protein
MLYQPDNVRLDRFTINRLPRGLSGECWGVGRGLYGRLTAVGVGMMEY